MSTADTQHRLDEIEKQLANLVEEQTVIKAKWESEKEIIQSSRSLKSQIEQLRVQAEEFERQGDYGKVAEIRYGKTVAIERELEENRLKIEEKKASGDLIMKEEIDAEDIADIVSKWTGIPLSKMLQSERQKLLLIEDELHKRVIGQKEAVTAVSEAVKRSRAGMGDEKRPIGSFIFLGPTGVGKTELARTLADYLFDDEDAMIRIDMSEYMEAHTVSRLVGAPPGYVGYEEGGQLTEAVRRKPFSVVLLDEIEKAHPDIFNTLLQIMDYATLTDNSGRKADFRNLILIMTSNAGAKEIGRIRVGFEQQPVSGGAVSTAVERIFSPEFRNRLDGIITFRHLSETIVTRITRKMVSEFRGQLKQKNVILDVRPKCYGWLAHKSYSPLYGAREVARWIEEKIKNPFIDAVLFGKLKNGGKAVADVHNDDIGIEIFGNP